MAFWNRKKEMETAPEEAESFAEQKEPEEKKEGFFQRLKQGLSKTRKSFVGGLDSLFFGSGEIDDAFYDELEEILVMGDVGVATTEEILDSLRERVRDERIKERAACREVLAGILCEKLAIPEDAYAFEEEPAVVLVIGVNGVGKTTTIGKLAGNYRAQGKKVVIASADTFRAAASEQLAEWAKRAGADLIQGGDGADPAAVVFDAVSAAKARKADILLCDTAGRLHNKKNLMEELKKIDRVITREFPNARRENWIVLDATTGQNALSQAKEFSETTDLTGIILTKMDGTAKGGIAIAVAAQTGVPVKFIGVGESIEDLQRFDPDAFVKALFARDEAESEISAEGNGDA